MMADPMINVHIRMPDEMHEQLRLLAFQQRVSINSIIVKAVQKWLKEEK